MVFKSPGNAHQIFRHLYICMESGAFIQVSQDMLKECFCQTESLPYLTGFKNHLVGESNFYSAGHSFNIREH